MEEFEAVYTDGGVWKINPSLHGGGWAWCGVSPSGVRCVEKSGVLLPDSRYPDLLTISNNHTELFAVCKALAALPDDWRGTLYTDSQVTKHRLSNINQGKSIKKAIPDHWQYWLRRHWLRMGSIKIVLLAGHPTRMDLHHGFKENGLPVSIHNGWCDRACTLAMQAYFGGK